MKESHKKMIEACWSKDSSKRPAFSELFKKLHLMRNDFIDLGSSLERNVIDYEEEELDDETYINKTFCLDSVDFEEVFEYFEEISVEPISTQDEKDEEINQLKNEIDNLRKVVINQNSTISSLESKFLKTKQKTINMNKQIGRQNNLIINLLNEVNEIRKPRISAQYMNNENIKGIIALLGDEVVLSHGGKNNSTKRIIHFVFLLR